MVQLREDCRLHAPHVSDRHIWWVCFFMSVKKANQPVAISDGLPVAEYIFSENKKQIAALLLEGEPWFIGRDVCEALELTDTAKSIERLDEDEKLMRKVFVSGQAREVWLVNESGLYNLIFRSTKPSAKAFRRWVTQEVLPEIRKKGSFEGGNGLKTIENAILFAGLKVVKVNGINFYPYRDAMRRLGFPVPKDGMGTAFLRGRKYEPECFLNIDGHSMVSEHWINHRVRQADLKKRRKLIKEGGSL